MEYSVVIPVYNSQNSLLELHERLNTTLTNLTKDYEMIFVDDYSNDDSWGTLQEIKKNNPNHVKIIRLAKNYGQHNATLCGCKFTKGKRVVTIDDDLQQAPEDLTVLVDKMDATNAELVYGIGGQQHSAARRVGSSLYKKGAKYIDGKIGEGSSYRLIKRELVDKVVGHKHHFVLIEELLYWYTEHIEFVEVQHFERASGKSGYSPLRIFKHVVNISLNYSNWPLKFMVWGGAILSFISFLFGVFFIIKKIAFGVKVSGFTAVIVSIFFSTSVILLCFGIVGKYLNNIYVILNNKPAYSIKEVEL